MLKISMSGYYSYIRDKEAKKKTEDKYREKIREIFDEGRGTYGVGRVCGLLRKKGSTVSYDRVKGMMQEMGLFSIRRKKCQKSLTDSRKSRGEGYSNLVRDIEITEPFSVISSDISYIRTKERFGYTCQIFDVASNLVLAESMSSNMKKELVIQTIEQARRRWDLKEGTIFHSDRGSQYTSDAVIGLLKKFGIKQSFSRVGMPGDNAWSESFFANLKKEQVHWRQYKTVEEARDSIFEYIEVFYNRRRVQKRLGYFSPMQWLKQWQQLNSELVA